MNTILAKGDFGRRYEEARAGGAITPGHLIEKYNDTGTGKMRVHSVRGGRWTRAIAVEDALQGNGIATAYATTDLVRYLHLDPGDTFYGLIAAGENVAKGDWMISYGDGTMCKAAAAYLANVLAASTAVTNTTTETTFSNGSLTIPKNSLKAGDVLRIRTQGIATATNSTDTLNIKVKLGTDILAATGALDVANNDTFTVDVTLVVRTAGATGTYVVTGWASIGTTSATAKPVFLGSTVIDTTADQTLVVTATWSVANAGNSVRMDVLLVEHVKSGSSVINGTAGGDVVGTSEDAVDNSAGVTAARCTVLAR